MAISLRLSSITKNLMVLIETECVIVSKKTQYSNPSKIFCYEIDRINDALYVPLGMWKKILKKFPWALNSYPSTNLVFKGKLLTSETDVEKGFRDQVQVAEEIDELLKENHVAFFAGCTGFGKCFGPDQKLLAADRTIKGVTEIRPGDHLLGDDWNPRVVSSIISGQGEMYEIHILIQNTIKMKVITCNAEHILCLKMPDETIRELEVREYLALPDEFRKIAKLYQLPIKKPSGRPPSSRPTTLGYMLSPVSITELTSWTYEDHMEYVKSIILASGCSKTFRIIKKDLNFYTYESFVVCCWHAGVMLYDEGTEAVIDSGREFDFTITPIGQGQYFGFTVEGPNKRFLTDSGIVTHNTTIGCYAAVAYKVKTVILCFLRDVLDQWERNLREKTSAKVQRVKGDTLNPNADIYVIGVKTVNKIPREQLANIGLVILDEAHLTIKETFENALLRFQPMWVLGLSATPRRQDGLHKALEMYFGDKNNFIIRREIKPFTVIKVETHIKPEIVLAKRGPQTGKPVWSTIVASIANSEERHKLIVERILEVLQDPNEYILILTLRVSEGHAIAELFREALEAQKWSLGPEDLGVIEIFGSKKRPQDSPLYRVQVVGIKKGGVGSDDPSRTTGVIIDSLKDIEQYEGRIRARDCMIFDFVDNYGTFEKHWRLREAYYLKKGATIVVEKSKVPRYGNATIEIPQRY